MKAHLKAARISQKKANLVASLVRGLSAADALILLSRLPKKGAALLHDLISSAIANAENNAGQNRNDLFIKTLIIQKGQAFRRHIPIARGRARPIDKATSHLSVELGVAIPEGEEPKKAKKAPKKEKPKKEDIEYSATKPVESFHKQEQSGEADDATKAHEHGSSTFHQHRQGSRGS